MRPAHRPRTGKRRDDGVKVIRTDEVRYPGAEHPLIERIADENEEWRAGDRRLAPARDAGLAIEGRIAREQKRRDRLARRNRIIAAAVAGALLLGVFGWRYESDRLATTSPLGGRSHGLAAVGSSASAWLTGQFSAGHSEPRVNESVAAIHAIQNKPTPYFAAYHGLQLRLPVPLKQLTEVGFHQAAYSYALRMTTPLPDADLVKAEDHVGTKRKIAKQPSALDAYLIGSVIRMWRPRPGRPDTAADVGALPGTPVLSPVTGTIVKVKPYLLYGKYPDDEIHIHADGYDDLDIVLIHIRDVVVTPGSRVQAGVTQIGAVRKFSDKFHDQLADYTKGGGDHVHVQINNADDPKYKGLKGAIEPEE